MKAVQDRKFRPGESLSDRHAILQRGNGQQRDSICMSFRSRALIEFDLLHQFEMDLLRKLLEKVLQ